MENIVAVTGKYKKDLINKKISDDFINNMDRTEDITYEEKHYNYYAEKLKLEKV